MRQYLELLEQTLANGTRQKNRTGIDTFMIPGGMMKFNLALGFPILTTKKVAFKSVVGELLGFIRGYTNARAFRDLGCKVWDANANQNKQWLENKFRRGTDDLGRIYGKQWRNWNRELDQLSKAIATLRSDPTSRRNIVTAWNPSELNQMALPPCHIMWQLILEQGLSALHMTMYMRSADMFLGVPFNISSYGLLLSLLARATGYEPGQLTMFLADCHIYENHIIQVKEQLKRFPRELPELVLPEGPPAHGVIDWLERLTPGEINLEGYNPHPPIPAPMAV